jgi:PncC family amidohydrolase
MDTLLPAAHRIAERLRARGARIAVCESAAGGLISAALVAVPGASAFYLGGTVVYTHEARRGLMAVPDTAFKDGMRASTEAYARMMAEAVRARTGADWGLAETGASGPTGNGYGDPAGHACLAVAGPVTRSLRLRTGSDDRVGNMRAFAAAALALLDEALGEGA